MDEEKPIIERILEKMPEDAKIVSHSYEGANIVIYTKSKTFFKHGGDIIRHMVDEFKKRIDLRADSSIRLDEEETRKFIEETIPESAEVTDIIFEPARSYIVIEAKKPGVAIGKSGETLQKIKDKTLWTVEVKRDSIIPSKITKNIRSVLYQDSTERRKFLNKVGERVYEIKKHTTGEMWARVVWLGAGRQVGRSCILLQTPESNILLDCGVNVADEKEPYPFLNAPELHIQDVDAVIISHAHLDHCLPPDAPVEMADGSVKLIDEVKIGDRVAGIDWKTGKKTIGKCVNKIRTRAHKEVLKVKTPYFNIECSPNHRFFVIENLEVKEIKASELKPGMVIPAMHGQRNISSIDLINNVEYVERIPLPRSAKDELKKKRQELKLAQCTVSSRLKTNRNFIYSLERQYDSIYTSYLRKVLDFYNINQREFMSKHSIQQTIYPLQLDPELAQCAGYIAGDGHISSDYSIRITDGSIPCLKEYHEKISNVFNHNSIIRHHSEKTKNAYWLEINNAGILRFLRKNFKSIFNYSKDATVPRRVMCSSNEVIRAFIRGFADADGSVSKQAIDIASSSNNLLDKIQYLLSTQGIYATVCYKDNKLKVSNAESIKRFADIINFSHPDKRKKLNKLVLTRGSNRLYESIPISSIKFTDILKKIGLIGNSRQSNGIKLLPSALYDFYIRGRKDSYIERRTLSKILHLLNKRLKDLESAKTGTLSEKRISISLSRRQLSELTGYGIMQIQFREERDYKDEIYEKINKRLSSLIEEFITNSEDIINKVNRLTSSPIIWQKIRSIGRKKNPYPYLVDIEVDPNKNFIANGVVVHNSALTPLLLKYGYEGPIFCTEATRDIMALLQLDYIDVSHGQNRTPPYSSTDIKNMVKQTICLEYGEVTDITPDIRITFSNAGHILGSALTHIHIGEGWHNLLYSSDYKYQKSRLFDAAVNKFPRVETVITEATYGGPENIMEPRMVAEDKLKEIIRATLKKKGKVLIPVLGVGRSQEIMLVLEEMFRKEKIKGKIYIDGMVWEVTAIHNAYPRFMNSEVRQKVFYEGNDPFLSPVFSQVGSHKERQNLLDGGPCVILATSGMLVGGMSVFYLKELADNKKNSLILTCYQGEGSLGARIQRGEKEVRIEGEREPVKLNMEVHTISALSDHSDRNELISFMQKMQPSPRKIIINHGENSRCLNLASSLHKICKVETVAPRNLEGIRLR